MLYRIEISANYCKCNIVINGLGVALLNAEKNGSIGYPCNTELIGKDNVVTVEAMPSTIDLSILDRIAMVGCVKKYAPDDIAGPESGEIIAEFSLEERIMEVKANPFKVNVNDLFPFSVKAVFDSDDAHAFNDRFIDAKPIEAVDKLKKWAIEFRDVLERKDIDSLYALYEPKLLDYDRAYPEEREPDNRAWFTQWLSEEIFPEQPIVDFKMDDIQLVRWCEGRIWEIRIKDGNALWRTIGKDGVRSKIQVYVAEVNGKIKIVR